MDKFIKEINKAIFSPGSHEERVLNSEILIWLAAVNFLTITTVFLL